MTAMMELFLKTYWSDHMRFILLFWDFLKYLGNLETYRYCPEKYRPL